MALLPEKTDASTPANNTLKQWHDEQQVEDQKVAEDRQRESRVTELDRAFIAVRAGMPDTGDDEQDARTFVGRLGHLCRLLDGNPDLVSCPLAAVQAEADSPKSYALVVLRQAGRGREAEAARMLRDSFRASRQKHSEVLSWLTWRLGAEIMGKDQAAPEKPLAPAGGPGTDQAGGTGSEDPLDIARAVMDRVIAIVEAVAEPKYLFRRVGKYWDIRFGPEHGHFPDSNGLSYLAVLLEKPLRMLPALSLVRPPGPADEVEHTTQKVSDDDALKEYREKFEDLAPELEEARRNNDPTRAERIQEDMAALLERIKESTGVRGKTRRLGPISPEEKACNAVRQAIRRGCQTLKEYMPLLAKHLKQAVQYPSPDIIYIPAYDREHTAPDWKF